MAKSGYKRYSNFFWKYRGTAEVNQTYETSGYYTVKGTRYYSVYTTDDKWLGYVNANAINVYDYIKMKNIVNYNQYVWKVPTGCEGYALL